jgi:malate dehydrogenase
MARRKISIVGAGNVGAAAAQRLAEKGLWDVVLVDVVEGLPQGKALDLSQVGPVIGSDAQIVGSNDYRPTVGSDLFIVTAGITRKPGMSRDDLLKTNTGIIKTVAEQIKRTSPQAVVIVVSNPLDAMCYVMKQLTGFPRERVIGMAGVLDSARLRTFVAQELRVSVKNVQAFVLGGHGDTMVPLPRYCTVSGIPLPELLPADKVDAILKRTRDGGAEIVALLKTGSAYYAPSAAAVEMAEAILLDRKEILPCAAWLQGEYGLNDVYVGVPCKLGSRGMEQIVELKLTPGEQAALAKSVEAVRELQRMTGV